MRLFDRGAVADVVIGVGLIGGAVCEAVARLPGLRQARTADVPFDWNGAQGVTTAIKSAEQWLGESTEVKRVRVMWCAGRGGFASTAAALRPELDAFLAVIAWAESLMERYTVELHMLSSAGGLHEGQVRVDRSEPAETLRPYAQLKLSQERALEQSRLPAAAKYAYRASSVYGVPKGKRRLGMIPTLVLNALRRKPTTITALSSTLRDYVSAHDVGAYVAAESKPAGISYLVMGYPTSIFSLQLAVERFMQRSVPVVFTLSKDNAKPITFSPRLKPLGWRPSSIESNLARIANAVQTMPRA